MVITFNRMLNSKNKVPVNAIAMYKENGCVMFVYKKCPAQPESRVTIIVSI